MRIYSKRHFAAGLLCLALALGCGVVLAAAGFAAKWLIALVLLLAAVGMAVREGRYAYGQVAEHNAASLALQQKAGMTVCPEKIYWLME